VLDFQLYIYYIDLSWWIEGGWSLLYSLPAGGRNLR